MLRKQCADVNDLIGTFPGAQLCHEVAESDITRIAHIWQLAMSNVR